MRLSKKRERRKGGNLSMIPSGVANYRETNSVRRSRFRYFVQLSSFPFLDSSRSSRINVCWLRWIHFLAWNIFSGGI